MAKRPRLIPKQSYVVEWADASIDLDQEGQPEDFQTSQDHIAKTHGWFIKYESGKLLLAIDLWDRDLAKPMRSCHQIPFRDVLNVWLMQPTSLVYSTEKAASSWADVPTNPPASVSESR